MLNKPIVPKKLSLFNLYFCYCICPNVCF